MQSKRNCKPEFNFQGPHLSHKLVQLRRTRTTQVMRVLSLLPSATDTLVAMELTSMLVGRSHECDWPEVQGLPACTSSRLGDIPVAEIDAVMSASAAAVQEMALLGPQLAIPLLEYGLTVYHLHVDRLRELRPDVILTCLQAAHGAVLEAELLHAALEAALSYVPKVVHCAAQSLAGAWEDVQHIADALGRAEQGRQLVARLQQQMEAAATACRGRASRRVGCLQWPQPLYAAGSWVPEMIAMAGSRDVCGRVEEAVCLSEQDLEGSQPDVIIFALCGLTLPQSLRSAAAVVRRLGGAGGVWGRLPAVTRGRVAVVDGDRVFSRPGPLLAQSMEVLVEILQPEAQGYGHQGKLWELFPREEAAREPEGGSGSNLGRAGQLALA